MASTTTPSLGEVRGPSSTFSDVDSTLPYVFLPSSEAGVSDYGLKPAIIGETPTL